MKIYKKNHNIENFNNKIGIYYLYKDNKIVYIGSSKNIGARITSHKNGKYGKGGYYKKFDSFSFFECEENILLETEAIKIYKYIPIYNNSLPTCKHNTNKEYLNKKRFFNEEII